MSTDSHLKSGTGSLTWGLYSFIYQIFIKVNLYSATFLGTVDSAMNKTVQRPCSGDASILECVEGPTKNT